MLKGRCFDMKRKEKEKFPQKTFREKVAERLDVAKEVVLDVPKIVLLGNREAVIENYKGITEYTTERIVLEANPSPLRILGEHLEIKSVTGEMLFVEGKIHDIGFAKEV